MKIEVGVQEMLRLIWSHGDVIPVEVSSEIASALKRKMSTAQLQMECRMFIRRKNEGFSTISENKVDNDGELLYNKINGYATVNETMSKYTDLARG